MNYDESRYEYIKARCVTTPAGCWEWQGFRLNGYGQTSYHSEGWAVHRLMYWLANGAFPLERHVCHSCDNRPCCNPAHLFLGDQRTNSIDVVVKGRHYQSAKTHCVRGHELPPPGPPGSRRDCRECERIRWRRGILQPGVGRATKTHCKQGHPFAGDNLYVAPSGARRCRICIKAARSKHEAKVNAHPFNAVRDE